MAIIYPKQPDFKNDAEEIVYTIIKHTLPADYICYFNYQVNHHRFDIALLVPDKGIAVIEVKGWTGEHLTVEDNNSILFQPLSGMETSENSPLYQAERYQYNLVNLVQKKLNKNFLVIPMVCYPNMQEKTFAKKRMDIVSSIEQTIVKEDMLDGEKLKNKILSLFQSINEKKSTDKFHFQHMLEFRRLFETDEQINASLPKLIKKEQSKKDVDSKRKIYSLLRYISEDVNEEEMLKYFKKWINGTKLYFISRKRELLNKFKSNFEKYMKEQKIDPRFLFDETEITDNCIRTFNFQIAYINERPHSSFEIFNGDAEEVAKYEERLNAFHNNSEFNKDQYLIEHAPINTNINIKAGAGTGKTYSMVSRINFLIYEHGLTADQLKEAIVLITFTNEAAMNMKKRLQENFKNYFLLTRNREFFEMIEIISDMNISTIHSLAKRILQNYASKIGLGKKFRIVTGKYERTKFIEDVLDDYINQELEGDPQLLADLNTSTYHLRKRLKQFLDKLDNKNVDLVNDTLTFGNSSNEELDHLIQKVLKKAENHLVDYFNNQNLLRLKDLMVRIKTIMLDPERFASLKAETEVFKNRVKYVFVDEFQDTDDVQIKLLKQFQTLLNYKFFCVGDIKQCIYRFRGAESRAFDQLVGDTKNWGISYHLAKNYRSDKYLLERFESIFQQWGKGKHPKLQYGKEDTLTSHINKNENSNDFFRGFDLTNEKELEDHLVTLLNNEIEKLNAKGSIGILVRENSDVEKIKQIGLKRKDLNGYIETDVGGNLFQLDSTLDFYKLVLALRNPYSARHLYNLYSTAYIKTEFPYERAYENKKNTSQLVDLFYKNPPIKGWNDYIMQLKYKPVLSVLRTILTDIDPWKNYAQQLDLSNAAKGHNLRLYKYNLDLLFEKLSTISESEYITINLIEQYLKIMILTKQNVENRQDVEVDPNQKRIYCMTIHKSKGLEFDTVIIPYTNRDIENVRKGGDVEVLVLENNEVGYSIRFESDERNNRNRFNYVENENFIKEVTKEKREKINEETRILYVAMTRAKKNFFYYNFPKGDYNTRNLTWYKLVNECRD
ncbi:UvrD-helicase domain-containing protein [Bacillus sp. Marseille-P3661]|uniref:UvrD-helicase domain-containing protein n=1 Tax=Bacillus sp. Marseille-P3661 TaxID=1936234 RepID=UPI000C8677FD|nr:UvrD-helicase domain-containing protein [Bacillus sp. Marseille-P3661]